MNTMTITLYIAVAYALALLIVIGVVCLAAMAWNRWQAYQFNKKHPCPSFAGQPNYNVHIANGEYRVTPAPDPSLEALRELHRLRAQRGT